MASSITVPVFDKSDPKAGEGAPVVPFYLPRTWKESGSDPFGSTAMALAGGSMMLKNALGAWAALIAAVLSLFNQKPLRQKEGASSPLGAIAMSALCLVGVYIPSMLLQPDHSGAAAAAAAAAASTGGGAVPLTT